MRFLVKLRRSLQKKYFPTERDLSMRRWKADQGDQKLRLEYDLNASSIVLDLGGYRGDWAHDIHSLYGCTVHVFEPVKSFADGIRKRFEGNSAMHVHCCGLGKTTRVEKIGLSADASSMFQSEGDLESIQLIDVVDWFQKNAIQKIDLMKVNIEGGEYELLERLLESGMSAQIDNIQVQFHNIAPDSEVRMQSILNHMRATHQPTYQYHFIWENWQRNAA